MTTKDYTAIECTEHDTIEDVAKRLCEAAPAETTYAGVVIRVEEPNQDPKDIVGRYLHHVQTMDVRRRLDMYAVSMVQIADAESPGPGGIIDPHKWIHNPQDKMLYILWERLPDFSIGNVSVVLAKFEKTGKNRGIDLHVQHGPVVAAFGSLIVENSFRVAAMEARIGALEAQIAKAAVRAKEN
jgi:hypothetical protein